MTENSKYHCFLNTGIPDIRKRTMMRGGTKLLVFFLFGFSVSEEQTCSWTETNEIDPALKEFTYDVGDGPK